MCSVHWMHPCCNGWRRFLIRSSRAPASFISVPGMALQSRPRTWCTWSGILPGRAKMQNSPDPKTLATLPDDELLDEVQRQTFSFFWEGGHPVSGLALDRIIRHAEPDDDMVTVGGSGFAILSLLVAIERGWQSRAAVLERLETMLEFLSR